MKRYFFFMVIAIMLLTIACTGNSNQNPPPVKEPPAISSPIELTPPKTPEETQTPDPIIKPPTPPDTSEPRQTEPLKETQPVDPKIEPSPTPDTNEPTQPKPPNETLPIADEATLRGEYFDFAIKNRIDYIPEFPKGNTPTDSPQYLFFAFMVNFSGWEEDKGIMSKKYVEEVVKKYFDVEEINHEAFPGAWDFDGEKYIAVPSGVSGDPIYVLKELKIYKEAGRTINAATLDLCYWGDGYPNEEDMIKIREDVMREELSDLAILYTQKIEFYLESSTGNPVFLSNAIFE